MNGADAVVLVAVIGAAIAGYRRGLIATVITAAGVVIGAIAGIRLAPNLVGLVDQSLGRVAVGAVALFGGIALGHLAGQWLGARAATLVSFQPVRAIDRGLGLVGRGVAALLVAWLIALPLAAVPLPWLSTQIRTSAVLSAVDDVMPAQADGLSARLRALFAGSGLPQVLAPLAPAPDTPVDSPDRSLRKDPDLVAAERSVLKIRAISDQCHRSLEGSGFVIAPGRVVTNAHVVAGAGAVVVETEDGLVDATVVEYDPQIDIAVLAASEVTAPALQMPLEDASAGTSAAAVGYPLDGPYTISPMRIRAGMTLTGPNIYATDTVSREVYTLRGEVRPGNSGGPLLDEDGTVLGVIFGAAIDNPDVGFALTARQAAVPIARGLAGSAAVDTGQCTAD